MKLWLHQDIKEGSCYPKACVWWGNILPFSGRAPVGFVLLIRLPWWARRTDRYRNKLEYTAQLFFRLSHWKGEGPERYEFLWFPVEDSDAN